MSDARTIRCAYTCGSCSAVGVEVDVPARDPKTQDVVAWFRQVLTRSLIEDHRRRSPLCRATSLAEVRVPLADDPGYIGAPPTEN